MACNSIPTYIKVWAEQHKEDLQSYGKAWRESHKEKLKQYRIDNKERSSKYNQEYHQSHKTKRSKQRLDWHHRNKNNPQYKISRLLRSRLRFALNGIAKSQPTIALLGCDLPTLISHIESQFTEGMNWDNHGVHGWHLDHVKPCASFDLTKPEEQLECFNYKNLQPLWARDNLVKGSKG